MSSGPVESSRDAQSAHARFPQLVGDIGGTNARFARIEAPGEAPSQILRLRCADYPGPAEAIADYFAQTQGPRPHLAAMGIANPVAGDAIRMTNHAWTFSIDAVRQKLGLQRLVFVNDFTALALSLPYLGDADRRAIGGGTAMPGAAIGVIGAGTGLGVSGLIPSGHQWVPIEGEGGHVTISGQSEEEWAAIAVLAREFPHVSAERVLSGPGIVSLHQALAKVRGIPPSLNDAPAITEAAVAGNDALCVATMEMFCALLGTAAANLAVTLGARGGIYIGGGIVPQLGDWFASSPFRARFETKGRFSAYMAAIPSWVITAPYAALIGAGSVLNH